MKAFPWLRHEPIARFTHVAGCCALLSLSVAQAACKSASKDDQNTTTGDDEEAMIGPDGGAINQGGGILSIPAGALTKPTKITITPLNDDLSAGDYVQDGMAWTITPADLKLQLPAIFGPAIDDSNAAKRADQISGLLLRTSDLRQLSTSSTIHILQLGDIAQVKGPKPSLNLVSPELTTQPMIGTEPLKNAAPFAFTAPAAVSFDVMVRALDFEDVYPQELNGSANGACAFRLADVQGGSLRTGCTPGIQTASIEAHKNDVRFNLEPFQLPTLTTPVVVQVMITISDTPTIWLDLGFSRYTIGPCWQELCSGHGTCSEDSEAAQCICDPGYVPDGLTCVCQPQCEGRQCGPDGCGGRCEPGCDGTDICDQANGTCIPTESTDTTDTSDTTSENDESSSDTTLTSSDETTTADMTTDTTLTTTDESTVTEATTETMSSDDTPSETSMSSDDTSTSL